MLLTRTPPLSFIFSSGLVAALIFGASLIVLLSAPRIGVELQSNALNQVVVKQVHEDSPAQRAGLQAGDVIRAILVDHQPLSLDRNTLVLDPDIFATFAQFNTFIKHNQAIAKAFIAPVVTLQINNGENVNVRPNPRGNIRWLPSWYAWIMLLGSCILLIATAILAHNPTADSTFFLFITALGLWAGTLFHTLYAVRELVVPLPDHIHLLVALKHLAMSIFGLGGIALLWSYPTRLRFGIIFWLGTLLIVVCLVLNTLQWWELPIHAYYLLPYLLPTALGLYATLGQYRKSRASPINRAIMLWISSAIWVSVLIIYALYIAPTLISGYPISDIIVQFMFFILFLGFAFGVTKYRLFDIERWWFNTWLLFFLTLAVLVIDALVVLIWNISQASAFSITLLVSLWIYFPLREKLWKMIFRNRSHYQINNYLAHIIALFSSTDRINRHIQQYQDLFSLIYQPAAITLKLDDRHQIQRPALARNGLDLNVPLDASHYLVLTGKNRSRHLFNRKDQAFSASILNLTSKVSSLTESRQKAEANERARIMRDLHDDVGSKLLDLIHGSDDTKAIALARETLQSLRLSVIPLHQNSPRHLRDAIHSWRDEIQSRLEDAGIAYHDTLATTDDASLDVRQFINLTRILRELTSNLIKHSVTTSAQLQFCQAGEHLVVHYDQIGNIADPACFEAGSGLNNIASRLQEIAGRTNVESLRIAGTAALRYTINIPLQAIRSSESK